MELSAKIQDRKLIIPELQISKENIILSSTSVTEISTKKIQGNGYLRLESSPPPVKDNTVNSPEVVSIPFYLGGNYDDIQIDFD